MTPNSIPGEPGPYTITQSNDLLTVEGPGVGSRTYYVQSSAAEEARRLNTAHAAGLASRDAEMEVLRRERDGARGIMNLVSAHAYAAINPANWQKPPNALIDRASHYEKVLSEIADGTASERAGTTVEKLFARAIEAEAVLEEMKRALETSNGTLEWIADTAKIYGKQVGSGTLVENINFGFRTIGNTAVSALEPARALLSRLNGTESA